MRVLVCLRCVLSVLPYAHCDGGIWDSRCIPLHSILNGHAFSPKSDDQLLAATASGSGSASLKPRVPPRVPPPPRVLPRVPPPVPAWRPAQRQAQRLLPDVLRCCVVLRCRAVLFSLLLVPLLRRGAMPLRCAVMLCCGRCRACRCALYRRALLLCALSVCAVGLCCCARCWSVLLCALSVSAVLLCCAVVFCCHALPSGALSWWAVGLCCCAVLLCCAVLPSCGAAVLCSRAVLRVLSCFAVGHAVCAVLSCRNVVVYNVVVWGHAVLLVVLPSAVLLSAVLLVLWCLCGATVLCWSCGTSSLCPPPLPLLSRCSHAYQTAVLWPSIAGISALTLPIFFAC